MKTKEEKKAYDAAYRAANREKIKAKRVANREKIRVSAAAYRAANIEKERARDAAYYEAHVNERKAYQRAYRAANSEKIKAGQAVYRAANTTKIKVQKAAHYAANTAEIKAQHAAYRAANPEKVKDIQRMKVHGVSPEDFQLMLLQQKNTCAICDFVFSTEGGREAAAHVDHCHASGDIRGLLCGKCNSAIGLLKDSPVLLERAAEYLQSKLRDL